MGARTIAPERSACAGIACERWDAPRRPPSSCSRRRRCSPRAAARRSPIRCEAWLASRGRHRPTRVEIRGSKSYSVRGIVHHGGAKMTDQRAVSGAARRGATSRAAMAWIAALLSLAGASSSAIAAGSDAPSDTLPGKVALMHDVMVPMRDGVKLATDIYLPASKHVALPGRYPTILRRTPYNKEWVDLGVDFASHGYACVAR